MIERRVYKIEPICVNDIDINEVIIDSHIDKHQDHMTDQLALELVRELDGEHVGPDDYSEGFKYFVSEITYLEKEYRLVWLLEDNKFYIGVITAHRDRRLE